MLLIKPLLAFRPNKMDWIFAIKTFVAGMLALYVAFMLNLTYPIWAIGTVFVIANPYSGMAASKSVFRVLGTLLGAVVSVAATPVLMNYPWLFSAFLAFWVGLCLYISLLDRTPRSYIFMLAGYTTVIISFNIVYNIETSSLFDMAVGRVLEITVGVLSSALIMTTILPMNIGPAVAMRVSKTLKDTRGIFDKILIDSEQKNNYSQLLSHLARDIADIHVMATHLNYEKSTLQGMTKPLQEMLNQISLLVANLVAMSERIKQLDQIDTAYREPLRQLHQNIVDFLSPETMIDESELNTLPTTFEQDFQQIFAIAQPSQHVALSSLKMDLRHFIQSIRAIRLIWQRIQQGDSTLPANVTPLGTSYPNLHRDHGVALRGGISACLVVFLSSGLWILSGWKAGFMFAEMAAIAACILSAMDNPVPALKMFIRGNVYAAIIVFIYAYGIFPNVTAFWQLAVVLALFIIYCLLLFPHPPLTGLALPMLMGVIMGLNFQNRYSLDQVFFFDATIGTIMGPILAAYIIHLVRAMSPEISAKRILALHYQAFGEALYIPYGLEFRIHLRGMLDRIGILNTKVVQSERVKKQIDRALIETSAVVDLTRLQELSQQLAADHPFKSALIELQQQLQHYFEAKAEQQSTDSIQAVIAQHLVQLQQEIQVEDANVLQRLHISLNNISSSLFHFQVAQTNETREATSWAK
ncbi:fusaric acid resistance protein [Acinetobacter sp. NCu2D-2]|uniref:FUSC family protein n=1 Tax=Acinetobacter sp. NCu2D-2 TaxID=1608473 RepID=UPI0007CE050A|nr:FUSC family protein [Acinetobacter sp. NCu2D-2]ANF82744.1 fusaric acid resistance protein [Acinetobacter sp. NCu2D-2]